MPHEFIIVFHIFGLSYQVVRIFQNLDLKLQSYLVIYLFEVLEIQFMIHYEDSEAAIPFTSVEKVAAKNFLKIHTEAVVQTKAHLAEAVTRRCSIKNGALKNVSKFTGKHLW